MKESKLFLFETMALDSTWLMLISFFSHSNASTLGLILLGLELDCR